MNRCPCCSNTLLKHWKQDSIYWYCGACRQEMPNLELTDLINHYQQKSQDIFYQLSVKNQVINSFAKTTSRLAK